MKKIQICFIVCIFSFTISSARDTTATKWSYQATLEALPYAAFTGNTLAKSPSTSFGIYASKKKWKASATKSVGVTDLSSGGSYYIASIGRLNTFSKAPRATLKTSLWLFVPDPLFRPSYDGSMSLVDIRFQVTASDKKSEQELSLFNFSTPLLFRSTTVLRGRNTLIVKKCKCSFFTWYLVPKTNSVVIRTGVELDWTLFKKEDSLLSIAVNYNHAVAEQSSLLRTCSARMTFAF